MGLVIIGYVESPCKSCGRVRVELYSDGRLVCEKCLYNQNTDEYEDEDEIFNQIHPEFDS